MDPIYFDQKVLLAKIEATPGVDANPTGAANAILAMDGKISPMEGADTSRDLDMPDGRANETIPTGLHGKITFSVELTASGTAGTPPAHGVLMRGCGCSEVVTPGASVEYARILSGYEALTIYFAIGRVRYVMLCSRGNAKINIQGAAVPKIEFEFTGLFTVPTDAAPATPDLTNFEEPLVATAENTPVFTIDGISFGMASAVLNLGNKVEPRFRVGEELVLITKRAEKFEAKVTAQRLNVWNPYQKAKDAARVPIVLTHGTEAGKIATVTIPSAQVQRPGGLSETDNILDWELNFLPLPDAAATDQWRLTYT